MPMTARCASATNPVAPGTASVILPTMTRAPPAGCLWQRGRDLRCRPFPGSSCDGDEEYHFDEASEEVVGPRFADARPDDGDQVDEADDDVDDPVDSWVGASGSAGVARARRESGWTTGEHPAEQQQSDMHWHRAPQTHPGSASTTENQYTGHSFEDDQQGDEQTLIRSNHGLPGVADEGEVGRVCEVGVVSSGLQVADQTRSVDVLKRV